MKLSLRFSLLCIALICFSNLGISQKKNKKKANSSISSKKISPKKTNNKKKNKKKKTKKPILNKVTVKKVATISRYEAPLTSGQLVSILDMPVKTNQIDSIPEKVVTIVSAFKPQLKNVAKISFVNATASVDTNSVKLSYQVPSQNLSFQYQPIALVPRAIKKDSLKFDRKSMNIKIGLGNYFNQFIQVNSSVIDQNNQLHSLGIQNESLAGLHPIQKWNNTAIHYLGSFSIMDKKKLNTQIYFNQSNRYRYGLVPDTTQLPLSNFEQKLSIIGANFSLVNTQSINNHFNYAPILKFRHANLLNQAKDISIDLTSPVYFNFKNKIELHSDFTFSFNQYSPLINDKQQNYFFQLDPSIQLKRPHLQLKMGVRPTYANGLFSLYPRFELMKQLKDTNFILYAGWKTSLSNNQITQLMSQNHWISAPGSLPISSTESKYFQIAINANKRLNYNFNIALNDYRELPFFNQTTTTNNPIEEGLKFDVLFEKRAIAIEFKGDIRYQLSDRLNWKNQFKYMQFSLIRENEHAWGILPFELNSQFNWNYNKQLNFDASGQFWTGAKTSAVMGQAYQLNNTFVLNAGMQYTISNNWTFWAKGENLLDQKYQRWANFPSLGVQFIAGVQYKFSKK